MTSEEITEVRHSQIIPWGKAYSRDTHSTSGPHQSADRWTPAMALRTSGPRHSRPRRDEVCYRVRHAAEDYDDWSTDTERQPSSAEVLSGQEAAPGADRCDARGQPGPAGTNTGHPVRDLTDHGSSGPDRTGRGGTAAAYPGQGDVRRQAQGRPDPAADQLHAGDAGPRFAPGHTHSRRELHQRRRPVGRTP